jgi:ABC-2 type transport system ATP-binding protein
LTIQESMVSVKGLVKEFDGVRALDKVDLSVQAGIFGLIGPNGAGKTTLLRILLGLIRPNAGGGQVLGLDIRKDSLELRRRIGVLHERPSYPRTLTVEDYLEKVIRIYGSKKSAGDLLDTVDLAYARDRKIGHLSAGMHQRLGIAQAFTGDPELVFLDEPTSNLDVSGRDDVMDLIVNLHHERGISFFVSSHILSDLERICHRVAFINAGRVIEEGLVQDIIERRTSSMYRIITSDAMRLAEALQQIPELVGLRVSGANSITFGLESREIGEVQARVEGLAASLGIRIYTIEHARSLEGAFKEVMRDE